MTAFATPDQLASSLGVATPTDAPVLGMWTTALSDASDYLRTVIGQPITAGTATLDLLTNEAGEADIWLVPVTALTSVVDPDGNVVTSDDYTLKDQRLYLRRAHTTYTVTLAYGYATIPAEIVRWTKILAAAQIKVAPQGSLGMSNVASVAVDDGKVSYVDRASTTLPDVTAQWLKATFGGPQ
jgi:hypothetical protein